MVGISSLRSVLSRRVIRIGSRRCYGCAAQLDYDSDEYSDEEIVPAVVETARSCSVRGVQWVVIGEPGAKKHVYAERLSKLLEVPHISMGTLVRQELSPVSSLYKQIAAAVNQGKLVPEDIIYGLLSKRLEEGNSRGETGFILDGFPRTRAQAEILDQIADVDLVVNLKSSEEHLVKKHLRTGPVSNLLEYHNNNSGSNGLNLNLLKSSTSNSGFAWNDKLRVYAQQSKPLEEYYRKQQKLIDFQVAGPPGETWHGLLAALHLQHVDAVNSTKKLTV